MKIDIQNLPVCLINLPERTERLRLAKEELSRFFNPDKQIHVISGCRKKTSQEGIAQAHLDCVSFAKENNWPVVIITEDDLLFTSDNSRTYADQCFSDVPEDYDILLSGVYHGSLTNSNKQHWAKLHNFCALHFYIVNERAYDKILNFDFRLHIDRWMGSHLNCFVTKKFWCIQRNGWSDNVKREVNYDSYLTSYKLLT